MAYPGVGILAGDSLQYLSVVTAHAVIMVFFMIMPLLFGAFGNFLLPTQLGVHDVAFPRLNSAAFWFLPAGLLMLVQLVCLDRRYQRMNCYNIREIQTILKSKYSPNVSESADVRFNLNDTAIGLRYSLGGPDFLDPAIFTYYRNAITNHPRYRAVHELWYAPIAELDSTKFFMAKTSSIFNVLKIMCEDETLDVRYIWGSAASSDRIDFSNVTGPFLAGNSTTFTQLSSTYSDVSSLVLAVSKNLIGTEDSTVPSFNTKWEFIEPGLPVVLLDSYLYTTFRTFDSFVSTCSDFLLTAPVIHSSSFSDYASSVRNYFESLRSPLLFEILLAHSDFYFFVATSFSANTLEPVGNPSPSADYTTSNTNLSGVLSRSISILQENTTDQRFMRFTNPVFQYDFKVGNYMPDDMKKMNPHLFNTIKDITTGIRKSAWFASDDYSRMLKSNMASHLMYFGDSALFGANRSTLTSVNSDLDSTFNANSPSSTNVTFSGGFYNFFLTMSSSSEVLNTRWIAVNTLDQKFYKMFATSSMQQRIHANWRQLKFTREAWRCKLLAARHQNTLYKRYLNEDSVVWAVERNAKDVLPGWAMITPFSARSRFTAIGKVDIGLMGVFLVLNSSIVSSANFLVTYRYLSSLNNRKMRDARSFFTEGVMVASWMMIAANPMLAIGILMLLSDRHWQTSFFDYSGGGDTVLFQHMFWFFGHPEVYVIMIPAFGFNNTILSYYLRKRVSARASLLYSMYTIAFLGFFVWGHHMYMVGLAHTTRMLFSTLTVMISVPAATKLMHWCVTLVNSSFVLELPMFFQLLFIFFFVSGGISGMAVAHTGMDILFHDSFYVVGHFHVMLAGSAMFASFGAFYFYFPAIFGVKFSRIYGYLHAVYYLTGQLMTVIPMMWLGYAAMPRRVLDYPAALGGWHAIVSAGHMLSVAGMMAFFIMIFDSIRQGRAATRNSFGVARFNTRLNFYIYEGARTWFLQRKGWYLSRFNRHNSIRMNKMSYVNNEYLETTLYSYVILKK
jgi:heme/copper-type cytochrome/quinol oxidase subunit 1